MSAYRNDALTRLRDRRVPVYGTGEVYVDEVIEHETLGHCTVVEIRGGKRQQLVVRFPEGNHACFDVVTESAFATNFPHYTFKRFGS